MKNQAPESCDLERDASSWSGIDLTLIAVRFAEEANMVAAHRPASDLLHTTWDLTAPIGALRPWCDRTPTGYAAWFTTAAMATARLLAVDLETAADLVEQEIVSSGSFTTSAGARAWLVHPRTATWQ